MPRTLLIVAAIGALVSLACFSILHAMGGMDGMMGRHHHFAGDMGPTITRDLPWSGSDTISLHDAAEVTYTQGPVARFTVTGPKALVDTMTVEGGSLESGEHHRFWGFMGEDHNLRIAITSPNTHAFHLSGAQSMTIAQYDQDSLEMHLSGASEIKGSGKAKRIELHMSGADSVDLGQLPVDDASVHMSGAGSLTLNPKQSADIAISGAGHVSLLTKPARLHSSISGVGDISQP